MRFYINRPNSQKATVMIDVSHRGQRYRISTGVEVITVKWNQKKEMCISRGYAQGNIINGRLSRLRERVCDYISGGEVSKHGIMGIVNSDARDCSLSEFIDPYIREKSRTHAYNTIKGNRYRLGLVRDIMGDVTFNDFSWEHRSVLINELYQRGYNSNNVSSIIKDLKAMFAEAHRMGVHSNEIYKMRGFRPAETPTESIYLTLEQLDKIRRIELPEHLRRSADLFLVSAFTGVRASDRGKIMKSAIRDIGVKAFEVKTKKTGKRVFIPVHPVVNEILEKYGSLPELSDQKLNRHIKEVCKRCGFIQEVMLTKTTGGKRSIVSVPLFETVTTHTARRSFATNAYKMGVPINLLMDILGHSSVETFFRYIKIKQEESAVLAAESEFFR